MTFRWLQKEATLWAEAGFEQAFEQFVLKNRAPAAPNAPRGTLTLHDAGDSIRIDGESFSIQLERGALVGWECAGETYLHRPLRPNYYRAMTDNDRGLSNFVPQLLPFLAESAWKRTNDNPRGRMRAQRTDEGIVVVVRWGHPFFWWEETRYLVRADGSVELTHRAVSRRKPIRVGVQCALTEGFAYAEWVGRGPEENYPDRKSGCVITRYRAKIETLEHPYMRPQENGARCDVETLTLEGDKKRFSVERLSDSLQFSAWRYSQEALDAAEHQHELSREAATTLSLDGAMRGVGGDLPGALALHAPYELKAGTEYRLHILLRAGK